MEVAKLTSADINKLSKLVAKREELEAKISDINKEITALGSGSPAPAKRGRKPGAKPGPKAASSGKRAGRGKIKDGVLKHLAAAGPEGMAVKDLAAKLRTKPGNIHSFFQTTGKKIPGIMKAGRGCYAYTPAS